MERGLPAVPCLLFGVQLALVGLGSGWMDWSRGRDRCAQHRPLFKDQIDTFSPPKLNHTQMAGEAVDSHTFGGNPKW